MDWHRQLLMKRMFTVPPKQGTSSAAKQGETMDGGFSSRLSQAWNRFIGPKEMPPRWTPRWYGEVFLICTVFAITGSSTMILVSCTTALPCQHLNLCPFESNDASHMFVDICTRSDLL
jgi:hypothetical protein